jgi:N,N'-diacetylchitobiose transport system substrate-binding protein
MRYAFLAVLIVVALFVALDRLHDEPDDGGVSIEFWCYGTGGATNPAAVFWEDAAQRFADAHPGVTVKVVADIPHNPYLSVLTTRFIGGNPPDVMITDDGYIGQLAKEGLIMPLDELIRSDPTYHSNDFPPSMVNDARVDGERYGIPWYGGFGCLFYRTDILESAGQRPPETWDDLIRVCKALQETKGLQHPFAMDPKAAFWLMPWIWQNGGSIMTEDLRQVTIDTPESVEAIQFVRGLMYDQGIMNPDLATGAKTTDLWSTGQAAIIIGGSWDAGRFDELYPQWQGKWATAPVPAGKHPIGFFGGQHLIMSKHTEHPDLAWELMSFVTSTEAQYRFADMTGYPPGNLRVYEMPVFQEQFPYFGIMPTVIDRGRNNPFAPFFRKIWYELFQSNVLDVVMRDPNADIVEAVRRTAAEMQAAADDYWDTHDHYVQGK